MKCPDRIIPGGVCSSEKMQAARKREGKDMEESKNRVRERARKTRNLPFSLILVDQYGNLLH
jgi:hypothetical protein